MKDENKKEIDTDASAAGAAAAASAAATVATTVKTVVKTKAAAEAAAVAAAPAAASVSEEKDSWTLNIINVLVFGKLVLHVGVLLFFQDSLFKEFLLLFIKFIVNTT